MQELREQLSELAKEKFDNLSTEFDNKISLIQNKADLIDAKTSQAEANGYLISKDYYGMLTKLEKDNIAQLKQERSALQQAMSEALANGIDKESEAWYDMVDAINGVDKALEEANLSLIEFGNSMRDLDWEVFDFLQDRISKITDESDFLIDLLSNKNLFDKAGNFTNEGLTTAGLHGVNYNVLMAEADKYGEELQKVNKDLAKDPYDTELIKRKYELVAAQQESILAAEKEKEAIRDLVEEGIKIQLEALKDLIDKRKDALRAEKDLYDCQKNVQEKTDNISAIEKQLEAYQGDTSEETRAKIQQLKVSLEEAQSDLKETEYDKYISDQERLLDSLYLQYEETLNMRLDNIDALLGEIIAQVNASASDISSTIHAASDSVGYLLSNEIRGIWDPGNSNSVTGVITKYGEGVNAALTTVNATINGINANILGMVSELQKLAQSDIASVNNSTSSTTGIGASSPSSIPSYSSPSPSPSPSQSGSGSGGGSSWGSWFVYKKDTYPKGSLNTETSIVDRLKYHDYDSSFGLRQSYYASMGGSGTYTGSASQNTWMISEMKSHGYKKGTKSATKGMHLMDEDGYGSETTVTKYGVLQKFDGGETVFSKAMTENLWKLAQNPTPCIMPMSEINVQDLEPVRNEIGDVNISFGDLTLPDVTNTAEFADSVESVIRNAMCRNGKTKECVKSAIVTPMLGKNSLSANKYR